MTDTTSPARANGAPRSDSMDAKPRAGDARVAPELATLGDDLTRELDNADATPKDMAASSSGDVSSEKAATMAKAKSTTTRSTAARATPKAAPKPAPQATVAAAQPAPALNEEDSILIAGIERAEAEAERLRRWAEVRRREAHEHIRAHPLGSSVMVFAAGMIFGLLMARR